MDYITKPPPDAPNGNLRKLTILGSTGSIGVNALKVAERGKFKIRALAGGTNVKLLAEQAKKFRPTLLAVADAASAGALSELLSGESGFSILYGAQGFASLAADPETDCVLSAQMGSAGLDGTLAAALHGKMIALANKESLVMAGGLLRKICASSKASILPVDSEHYALFQCSSGKGQLPKQFILTASGGPFLRLDKKDFAAITPAMALAHPNWAMGKKITIDSATLLNKGLEFIEALQLFGLKPENVSVLVHPQSIVHSLVRFGDNSLLAQLAVPDMKLPISACLHWPGEQALAIECLNLAKIGALIFEEPDEIKFPCLGLAKKAAAWRDRGNWQIFGLNPAAIVLTAANDAAVSLFLNNQCAFSGIEKMIALALQELVYECEPEASFNGDSSPAALASQGLSNIRRLERLATGFVLKNAR